MNIMNRLNETLLGVITLALVLPTIAFALPDRAINKYVTFPSSARYVFLIGDMNGNQEYLLDTETGRIWTIGFDKGGKVLTPIPVVCKTDVWALHPDCSDAIQLKGQ